MSEVNKLDNTACPFNPEQYKKKIEIDDIAPAGSFPWAMIKVYLGKQVSRNGWASSDEYIKLIPASTGSDGKNIPPQIWIVDKDDEQTWQPTQEDMVACDWALNCMLSFDLKVETARDDLDDGGNSKNDNQYWGYASVDFNHVSAFGTLTNLQSTIGVGSISEFYFLEVPIGSFYAIELAVDTENQPGLRSKSLEVTVNGSTYNLGSSLGSSQNFFLYDLSDATKQQQGDLLKLSDLLKQNVGKTLHFCFNWK
ncbi:DUF2829 domain-containing protein [Xenorhabdus sp. Reich]|uniref:DUF2829 domain-containing protein n=1 Tax=Xenorhabdus littoralis TaxID=2582835 RepID=A0ABU4SNT7_9GAMM|nr:MW1434 family type I TA system toxin [Xenorhabdus sp. Reich]MDX8000297.1 DUF2829 domain-containing protein [Xenorhabdus sp. Reich]